MAFTLDEMGAMKGLEDRSDVFRLNALVSSGCMASVWRMDNKRVEGYKNHNDQFSSYCNTQRKEDDGAQKGVAVGVLDSGCFFCWGFLVLLNYSFELP